MTFTQVHAAVFHACFGEICHPPFDTQESLVGVIATECCDGRFLAAPGNAARSYVVDKIEGHDLCLNTRMPLGGPYLSESDTLLVRRWICTGAPSN